MGISITTARNRSIVQLKKEKKKIKAYKKEILSTADREYKLDLKSDIEDIKRAKTIPAKEKAIERAEKRRRSRAKTKGISHFRDGGQGYAAREDESLGMRTGAERTKSQSMRDRRDESYGAFGNRPNQRINRKDGGWTESTKMINEILGESSRTFSDADRKRIQDILGAESSRTISDADRKRAAEIIKLLGKKYRKNLMGAIPAGLESAPKKKKSKSKIPAHRRNKGGVASYAHGGVEAADKEGSRLSISMERQEDAGFSPSEADFDQQHRLSEEGIMEVGADVKIIQGHNSRASLGETEGVRGTGAMVKGKQFKGVF